ncbi:MAG: hypothetical protein J5767_12540 [Paludibacteraceae bacterium]|nr:hypothetical protein [Paludibacteraceae bacterium]
MTLNELINELSAISRRMSTGDVPLLINSQPIIITEIYMDPSAIDLHVKIDTKTEHSMYAANSLDTQHTDRMHSKDV